MISTANHGKPSRVPRPSRIILCMLLLIVEGALWGQAPRLGRVDLGATYVSQRSLRANTAQNFWMAGGSVELGFNVWRGFGFAGNFTGGHTNSIGSNGAALKLLTTTAGPRYRLHMGKRVSVYGEGLFGVAHGADSAFPSPSGAKSTANSFAWQTGGGVDYRISSYFAVRALDVGYTHTSLPNGGNDTQNILRLGTGVIFRFGSASR